jgi:HPt (histidine-containing phosphotransfer) domain-containing protein
MSTAIALKASKRANATATALAKDERPPLDFALLFKTCEYELPLIARMLDCFLQDTQIDMIAIAVALESNDSSQIVALAHRVKGSAATIGAHRIQSEAAQLESLGLKLSFADAPICLARLRAELQLLQSHIAQHGFLRGAIA